jgi:hypothetical protein
LKAGEQRRFAMRKPIPLRLDYNATRLRRIARESEDGNQVRRLLALAVIMTEVAEHRRRRWAA